MRHPRVIIASVSLAAAAAIGGGITAAAATTSHASSQPAASQAAAAAVRTPQATVDQVAYNGHLLYTFADDHAGQVSGQGVEGFFVATPGLTPITGSSTAGSSTPASPAPAAPSGNPYGY